MRLIFMLALLLPVNISAESYWQRFKNYIAYYLLGGQTTPSAAVATVATDELGQPIVPQPPLPATIAVPPSAAPTPLTKQFRRPITTSPAITTYKGTLGDPYRTAQTVLMPTIEKPTETKTNEPTVPEKPKPSAINLQPLIIQKRIIDGYNVIQLQVAEQTANYCGYHALKNAIAIASALYFNKEHFLELLQSEMDPKWLETIQRIRNSDDVEWLTQEEIYNLINKFAVGSPYPITAIEDINRLRVGEGILPQTMRGLIDAQQGLIKKDYMQAFIVGTMNQETNKAGHWVTVVLWIHHGTVEFIIADSLYNRPFYDRPTTLEFINLLTHMDFFALSIISSEQMQQYITRINVILMALVQKKYVLKEDPKFITKDLPVLNCKIEELPSLTIDTAEDFIKEAKKEGIFNSSAFSEIRQRVSRLLTDLKSSNNINFKIYQNTKELRSPKEEALQIQDYQWDIIEDLLQQLS